tara:strand:- start:5657 stop:5917 length:261 start_codon:yes stop_codon:yes gene_type:complete
MISSSLRFFNITAFNFIFSKPTAIAASIPEMTLFNSPTRVMRLNFSASRESRLMLMRLTPASFNGWASLVNCEPFVVNTSSSSPDN